MSAVLAATNLLWLVPTSCDAHDTAGSRQVHPAPLANFNRFWPRVDGWYERADVIPLPSNALQFFADYVSDDGSWAVHIKSDGIELIDDNLPDMGPLSSVTVQIDGKTVGTTNALFDESIYGKTLVVHVDNGGDGYGDKSGISVSEIISAASRGDKSFSFVLPRVTYTVPLKGLAEVEAAPTAQCMRYKNRVDLLDLSGATIRLHAGEMTAREMRTVKAVLRWKMDEIWSKASE